MERKHLTLIRVCALYIFNILCITLLKLASIIFEVDKLISDLIKNKIFD